MDMPLLWSKGKKRKYITGIPMGALYMTLPTLPVMTDSAILQVPQVSESWITMVITPFVFGGPYPLWVVLGFGHTTGILKAPIWMIGDLVIPCLGNISGFSYLSRV